MKYSLVILFILPLYCFTQSNITWSEPVMVSDESTGNSHPRIGLDAEENPVVIWGHGEDVRFARWYGINFTPSIVLDPMGMSIFTASWAGPDMAAFGDTIYVVFKENPEDLARIHMVHSYDGGITFSEPVIVDGMLGDDLSRFPLVTVNDVGQPIVSFMKLNSAFLEPRYVVATSDDFGNSFNMDVLASDFSGGEVCDCCPAGIAASENYVVNLYRDNLDNLRNAWAGISTDGGNMFMNGLQIDQTDWVITACPASGPDGIIIGDSLYSVFMSGTGGSNRVYFSKSSLASLTDEADERLQEDFDGLTTQNYPRIANYEQAVATVWKQNANTESEIALLFTQDISNGLPLSHDTIAMLEYYGLENADVAVSSNTVHVVWQDNFNDMVMYRKGMYKQIVNIAGEDHVTNNSIILIPNPVVESFKIILDKQIHVSSIKILSVNGSIISGIAPEQSDVIQANVSSLSAGVYFVSVTDLNGNNYYSMFIKH